MSRETDEDKGKTHFRAISRVFALNGEWFFSAREGEIGPFKSMEEAELEGRRFVNQAVAEEHLKNGTIEDAPGVESLRRDMWDGQPDTQ